MSTLTHPLQHISGKDHDRYLRSKKIIKAVSPLEAEQPPISALLNDIDGIAGEEELAKSVVRLDKASTAYNKEICAEKTQLMINTTSGINT